MSVASLIIHQYERRNVRFVKSYIGKKMFSFDWSNDLPSKQQYEDIAELTLSVLREDSPEFSIEILHGPVLLPDSFEFEGVNYLINVEKNK